MMYGITGRPGGGKSYRAVQLILEALKSGRDVVTNIPLTIESPFLHAWDWDYLKPDREKSLLEQLNQTEIEPLKYPNGSMYVLDECWRGFQSGTRIDQLGEKCLAFFKEHRHRVNNKGVSDDIFLVTQDLGDIATCIRQLCDQTILCEKPSDLGIKNMSIRYYMTGAVKGMSSVAKLVIKTEQERLKPEVYNNYKSNTLSEAGDSKVVEGSAISSTFFQSMKFKLMIFGLVSAVVVIGFSGQHLMSKTIPKYQNIESTIGTGTKSEQSLVKPVFNAVPTSVTAAVVVDAVIKPFESSRWRIAAWIRSQKQQAVYIQDLSNRPKRIDPKFCVEEFNQLTCTIDNEVITRWSGPSSGTSLKTGVSMAGQQIANK